MPDGTPHPVLVAQPAPVLPVERLVVGKSATEAAALLPRLFNLCRVAQGIAAEAALGLAVEPGWEKALRQEILREHALKLCLKWPGLVSLPPVALPRDWVDAPLSLRNALFGPTGRVPDSFPVFERFLQSGSGVAPVLQQIALVFRPGEACRDSLPITTAGTVFARSRQENSPAGRQSGHPVLQAIEDRWGRGPLWSAAGVAFDLAAVLDGPLPAAHLGTGEAIVPAARGFYGLRAGVEGGEVTELTRVTPTDHLLAQGGAMDQSLATLPPDRARALAPLVMAVLDPCLPVSLKDAKPQEAQHA